MDRSFSKQTFTNHNRRAGSSTFLYPTAKLRCKTGPIHTQARAEVWPLSLTTLHTDTASFHWSHPGSQQAREHEIILWNSINVIRFSGNATLQLQKWTNTFFKNLGPHSYRYIWRISASFKSERFCSFARLNLGDSTLKLHKDLVKVAWSEAFWHDTSSSGHGSFRHFREQAGTRKQPPFLVVQPTQSQTKKTCLLSHQLKKPESPLCTREISSHSGWQISSHSRWEIFAGSSTAPTFIIMRKLSPRWIQNT